MHRLPSYDRSTRQAEFAAFISLGFVGVSLIAAAVADSGRYASQREQIVAALASSPVMVVESANGKKPLLLTNVITLSGSRRTASLWERVFSRGG